MVASVPPAQEALPPWRVSRPLGGWELQGWSRTLQGLTLAHSTLPIGQRQSH